MAETGNFRVFRAGSRVRLKNGADLNFLIPLFSLFMFASLWAATSHVIKIETESAETAIQTSSGELAETYEAQVVRVLREIDHTLSLVEYALQQHGPEDALLVLAGKDLLPPTLLFTVALYDSQGVAVGSDRSVDQAALDGDQLEWYRQNGALNFTASQQAAESSEWIFRIGRRLADRDGGFAGVAVITVDAAFFVSNYDTFKLGRRGLLALVDEDGSFRVRRVGDEVSTGGRFQHINLAAEAGSFQSRADLLAFTFDDMERYTSIRQLFGYPLYVVVGLSRNEHLADAREAAQTYTRRALAVSAILLLITIVLWVMNRKLVEARRLQAKAKEVYSQEVEHLAFHDALTGLPNRSLYSKLLTQGIRHAQRHKRQLAVLFIDLDRFKYVNDTLGHKYGDELLNQVALRLQTCLRESDTVARLGGDEFVVLLPEISRRIYVATVATKIIEEFSHPYYLRGETVSISASIGIATYPEDGPDEATLTKNADIAMYKVKNAGKNSFQFFSEEIQTESLKHLELESAFRVALERNQLKLYYHPKRDLASGKISGLEALLRWEHPEWGVMLPKQFLPFAESSGLIHSIGSWVILQVCTQAMTWQQRGIAPQNVSINLTQQQFLSDALISDIQAALADTGLDPGLLELEVDENTLLQDVDRAMATIAGLKQLGVHISIDNFGVIYSSIKQLSQFSLTTVKIDHTLVRDIAVDSTHNAIADAVVRLGHTLGIPVVAQGVETAAQAAFLRDNACDQAQGFYFDQPMPAEMIEKKLLKLNDQPVGISQG